MQNPERVLIEEVKTPKPLKRRKVHMLLRDLFKTYTAKPERCPHGVRTTKVACLLCYAER